jgi:hypothetical protein
MYMKAKATVAALAVTGLALVSPGVANAATETLHAKLTGSQVVPGPGDDNAKGTFKAKVKGDQFCYTLKVQKIARVTGAHIHAGDAESTGAIVLALDTSRKGGAKTCTTIVADAEDTESTISESELAAIQADPSLFYVDVHNDLNPDGAIRGQLSS